MCAPLFLPVPADAIHSKAAVIQKGDRKLFPNTGLSACITPTRIYSNPPSTTPPLLQCDRSALFRKKMAFHAVHANGYSFKKWLSTQPARKSYTKYQCASFETLSNNASLLVRTSVTFLWKQAKGINVIRNQKDFGFSCPLFPQHFSGGASGFLSLPMNTICLFLSSAMTNRKG